MPIRRPPSGRAVGLAAVTWHELCNCVEWHGVERRAGGQDRGFLSIVPTITCV